MKNGNEMTVNRDNYFNKENDEFMSSSQYKAWTECEIRAFYEYIDPGIKPEEPAYFTEGKFGHAFFEGEDAFEKFKASNAGKICYKNKPGQLLSVYAEILEGCKLVANNKQFMEYLQGTSEYVPNEPVKWGDFQWKFMLDKINLEKRRIVDIKFMSSYDLNEEIPFYEKYRYWTSMAIYKKLAEAHFSIDFEIYLAVIEKSSCPNYDIISMNNPDRIQYEIEQVEKNMPRIAEAISGFALTGCQKCYVCKKNKEFKVYEARSLIK